MNNAGRHVRISRYCSAMLAFALLLPLVIGCSTRKPAGPPDESQTERTTDPDAAGTVTESVTP